jgi:alginate O-acetyltransferase complex protein AlgI
MNFYSFAYFGFFAIAVTLYYLVPPRLRWVSLLCASLYFYSTFQKEELLLLAACTGVAYFAGLKIGVTEDHDRRRRCFIAAVVLNIAILFLFKYFNFFNGLLGGMAGYLHIPYRIPSLATNLPLGISFYVFLIIAYLADVYRGDVTPERHAGKFAVYVAFFPKILAGPIERARTFLPQLHEVRSFAWATATDGIKLILWGIFKKVVIADRLARFVDIVYGDPRSQDGPCLALAVIFYSFQIYCDFSGYTDIAIGSSQVLGFRLADNFNRPYSATSVSDFWRRWHISLSTWLRDYLYIPLKGSRAGRARQYLNVMVVFFVCGLWHGANWTFIAWGLVHGLFIVVSLLSEGLRERLSTILGLTRVPRLRRCLKILVTFILVSFAWIFFRANTLTDAVYIVTHVTDNWRSARNAGTLLQDLSLGMAKIELFIAFASLLFFGIIHHLERHEDARHLFSTRPLWFRWTLYYILALSILLLSVSGSDKFIYFQF